MKYISNMVEEGSHRNIGCQQSIKNIYINVHNIYLFSIEIKVYRVIERDFEEESSSAFPSQLLTLYRRFSLPLPPSSCHLDLS